MILGSTYWVLSGSSSVVWVVGAGSFVVSGVVGSAWVVESLSVSVGVAGAVSVGLGALVLPGTLELSHGLLVPEAVGVAVLSPVDVPMTIEVVSLGAVVVSLGPLLPVGSDSDGLE